jgi:tellurite resistance protein TerC
VDIAPWVWPAFAGVIVGLLAVDLVAFGRRGHEIGLRRAIGWSVGWTLLGLAVAPVLWAWQGRSAAEEYFAGYLIEKSLSVDNLFVFCSSATSPCPRRTSGG